MITEISTDRRTAQRLTAHHTGIVITVYFRPESTVADGSVLLGDTVEAFCTVAADPAHIILSVDGPGPGRAIAESLAQNYGVQVVYSETNRGKLAAARLGVARLLENSDLAYLALVDQDGDHFANELLNLLRMAGHVVAQTQSEDVLVMGSRLSRRRSMGLLRAEGEELASRILLDALQFHAAQTGAPLPLQYLLPLESVPDFHAGYKLFSRRVAQHVFLGQPHLAACPPDAYFRHAIEAVMVVEAIHAGATLAAVSRRAYDEQPISLFAHLDRARLTADLIIWPCKRLNIPGPFVAQWLTNHLPCLALATLLPEGREELLTVARLVHDAFHLPPPDESLPRPRFI
jgi:hypothetical protein